LGILEDIINTLMGWIKGLIDEILKRLGTAFDTVGAWLYNTIVSPLTGWMNSVISTLILFTGEFNSKLEGVFDSIKTRIINAFTGAFNAVNDALTKIAGNIIKVKDIMVEGLRDVYNTFGNVFNMIGDKLTKAINGFRDGLTWLANTVSNAITSTIVSFENIINTVQNIFANAIPVIINIFTNMVNVFTSISNAISEFLTLKPEDILEGYRKAFEVFTRLRM